jgi:hypothetical protein
MISINQIFIFGRSLGTFPVIYFSSKMKPKELLLASEITSLKNIHENINYFFEKIFNSFD